MSTDHQGTIELHLPSQLRFLSVVDAVVQSFSSEFGMRGVPGEMRCHSTVSGLHASSPHTRSTGG